LGVSYPLSGTADYCYITKKLSGFLYNVVNTYDTNQNEDILIPYTNQSEIGKLYDLFETDAFTRYLKVYNSMSSTGNYLEMAASICDNSTNAVAAADDGSGAMKKYILMINGTSIYPIYSIGQTFGLFNEIFEIIAVVLVVIMVILLWSFMSFTIKTRTKDIGILISLGASKRDLTVIFVIEGAIVAIGQVIISIIAAIIAKHYVRNYMVKSMGEIVEKYNILSFGIVQILIMTVIAVTITALATAIPLWGLSKKQPVEIIRKIET
jgi:ABC-type antimicrobial peptide transport system permease subunit